ncbi:MAG: hypothetical protein NXI12_15430, partial [Alphaproteobacteria bacterium]|nr:hypothetical protein [Alphaproteobacteria bacterium]
ALKIVCRARNRTTAIEPGKPPASSSGPTGRPTSASARTTKPSLPRTQLQRRRRLQFIEEIGVECALWPCLFWDVEHTFTQERASDPRRVAREEQVTLEEALRPLAGRCSLEASDGEEDLEPEGLGVARHSVKRLFSALALGKLLGFGGNFPLLEFVYDLGLWTSLGSKKNLQLRVPMRVMVKGEAFSPLYWRGVHLALLDLVRQVGYPQIFFTLAPYEWSLPYHHWLLDALEKQLKARLHLPVGETLHVAHVLSQAVKGLMFGRTGNVSKEPWTSHIFACPGEKPLNFFLRLEYQDGTRKAPTHSHHGSRRVHLHIVAFMPPPGRGRGAGRVAGGAQLARVRQGQPAGPRRPERAAGQPRPNLLRHGG